MDYLRLLSEFAGKPIRGVGRDRQMQEVAARDVLTTIIWKKVKKESYGVSTAGWEMGNRLSEGVYAALVAESGGEDPWERPNTYADRLANLLVTVRVKTTEGDNDKPPLDECVLQCVRSIDKNNEVGKGFLCNERIRRQ